MPIVVKTKTTTLHNLQETNHKTKHRKDCTKPPIPINSRSFVIYNFWWLMAKFHRHLVFIQPNFSSHQHPPTHHEGWMVNSQKTIFMLGSSS
jgi:hypothetical protein